MAQKSLIRCLNAPCTMLSRGAMRLARDVRSRCYPWMHPKAPWWQSAQLQHDAPNSLVNTKSDGLQCPEFGLRVVQDRVGTAQGREEILPVRRLEPQILAEQDPFLQELTHQTTQSNELNGW